MSDDTPNSAAESASTGSSVAMSPAEERLLFLDRLHPGSALYCMPVRYRLRGALDPEALHAALRDLVARNEALRRYLNADDRWLTRPMADLPWSVLDLSGRQPAVAAAEAQRHLTEQARRPIRTDVAPLARACLVREPGDRWTLLLNVHHLIVDQHAMNLLDQQLQELYGRRVGLATDVAVPRRCGLDRQDRAASARYWSGQLTGLGGRMSLPCDRSRPEVLSPRGDVLSEPLDAALATRLAELAADCSATEFLLLLAAYAVFLGRIVGPEVVIGAPLYGRTTRDERTIGMFANVLPIRVWAGGDVTYRGLIATLRTLVTAALAHQHVPLQDLVARLARTNGLGHHPLTQVSMSYVDEREWRWAPTGATAVRDVLPTGTAKYELLWTVTADSMSSRSALEFSTDLFSRGRAEDLHTELLDTLEKLSAAPDLPIGTVLAGAAVAARYTRQPVDLPVHEVVALRARANPEAVAVRHGARRVAYRELDAAASGLAQLLVGLGVRAGERVAVVADRGADAVIAFLAVLHAGAAYVPIDVAQPPARSHVIMRDSSVRLALCQTGSAAHAPAGVQVVELATALAQAVHHNHHGEKRVVTVRHPAYVMYTSGSTGTPKGVVVAHEAIGRLVPSSNFIRFQPDDVVAHLSNIAFDAATFEIWGALCAGATLAVVPREIALSPHQMARFLRDNGATVMFTTNALLNATVAHAPDAYAGLRVLLVGGDQYALDPIRRLLAAGAPGRLLNAYGPTENTTFSTTHEVVGADLDAGVIPIGAAIDGTYLRVLDERLSPVSPGGSGELYVGGQGLADGYTGDPGRTCSAFVADPFAVGPGQRLYRTGDLVRLRPDGAVVFQGRGDDQVKLSGFRVEIGEVERVLRGCPGVHDGAVLPNTGPDGLELLAAVVGPADPRQVKEFLRVNLPAYMLPTRYLPVQRLPMTHNGKVDRSALLATAQSAMARSATAPVSTAPVAAADPVSVGLADIWRDVLGAPDLGPDSDFFALGGTSIKALHLVAAVHRRFDIDLSVVTVLRRPSFAELAKQVTDLVQANGTPIDWASNGPQ